MDKEIYEGYSNAINCMECYKIRTEPFFTGLENNSEFFKDNNLYLKVDNLVSWGIQDTTKMVASLPELNLYKESTELLRMGRDINLNMAGLMTQDIISSVALEYNHENNPFIYDPYKNASLTGFENLNLGEDVTLKLSELSYQSSLTKISENSIFAEQDLSLIYPSNVGTFLPFEHEDKHSLFTGIESMTHNFNDMCNTWRTSPNTMVELGMPLTELTSIEYFNEVDLYKNISTRTDLDDSFKKEKKKVVEEYITNKLEKNLQMIDSDFINMWRGACNALASNNPDRVRHFCVSIRELFTHLLHSLAPTKKVEKWSSEPQYYQNNKPTRKARIEYICRNIKTGKLEHFVSTDVTSSLAFIDLFQGGTHKVRHSFDKKQLQALQVKAEGTLNYLIEIAKK
ncbi:MAG: hypothetical protein PHQ52_00690 [Candidatus Omnitrophica bacterium]|nr:hypothetical protein [Candidatus Omnitrophota bacterium]